MADEHECCLEECCCHETDAQHVYRFRPVTGTSVSFSVRCSNDAHICLSPVDEESDNMLQVFIGGWKNSKSGLRLGKDQDVARVESPDIVTEEEFRTFWLSWDHGHVRVGREGEDTPFLSWDAPGPLGVSFLGYTTGWGACGQWKFHDESLFQSECDCHYHFRAAHGNAVTFGVQASNDAHVALTPGPAVAAPMYEIFIGGWSNSKCAIRYTSAIVFEEHVSEDMATAETPDVLSADEMRSFTISWADGNVEVFIKGQAEPFMSWRDPQPIQVTHYGYKSAYGADAKWRFEV